MGDAGVSLSSHTLHSLAGRVWARKRSLPLVQYWLLPLVDGTQMVLNSVHQKGLNKPQRQRLRLDVSGPFDFPTALQYGFGTTHQCSPLEFGPNLGCHPGDESDEVSFLVVRRGGGA